MPINLILYTTSYCHLCEQAEVLLLNLNLRDNITWSKYEIMNDAETYERYEIKIPVLKRTDTNIELYWPFSEDELIVFLT
jgi:hypothetical protein